MVKYPSTFLIFMAMWSQTEDLAEEDIFPHLILSTTCDFYR